METGLRLQGKDGYRLLYTGILFCMVLTGVGDFAYKRTDGIYVIPVGCLKN